MNVEAQVAEQNGSSCNNPVQNIIIHIEALEETTENHNHY